MRWAGVLGLVLAVLALGCFSKKPDSTVTSGKAAAKPKLRIGWPSSVQPGLIRNFANRWASQQGIQLEMVPYSSGADLKTAPEVDLWVLTPAELPRWAAALSLLPLPERLGSDPRLSKRMYLPAYRTVLEWDQQRYALPLMGETLLCFSREDLFQDQNDAFQRQFGRPLKPPQTWEEFEETARFFQEVRTRGGDPAPTLPPLPESDADLEREFYSVAASLVRRGVSELRDDKRELSPDETFSFHFSVETGAVQLDTAGFVQALQILQRLQSYRPAQPAADWPGRFGAGQAVLCIAPLLPWIGQFQAPESPIRNKFGVSRVPGSRVVFDPQTGEKRPLATLNYLPYLGADGWLGVVPRSATQPDAAFALLAWLNEPQVSRDLVIDPLAGGGPFREEHLSSAVSWEGFGLGARTPGFVRVLGDTLKNTRVINPAFRLRIPDERHFRQALAARLRTAIVEKQDAEKVLKEVADSWRALATKKGQVEHRADYRRSLGLDP